MKKKIIIIGSILIVIVFIVILSIVLLNNKTEPPKENDEENYRLAIMVGDSMSPTLKNKQRLKVYDVGKIKRGDIVLIKYGKEKLIKRVVGLPHETIVYKDNTLYINDEQIKEEYLDSNSITYDFKETIDNCYYVLGDNRINSLDSRSFGCVTRENIIGLIKTPNK